MVSISSVTTHVVLLNNSLSIAGPYYKMQINIKFTSWIEFNGVVAC